MSRTFWLAGGVALGVYASFRGRRAAEALSPGGLRDRAQALAVGAKLWRDEVAAGKHDKESQLRARWAPARTTTPHAPELEGKQ